jgi:hypothetical protein
VALPGTSVSPYMIHCSLPGIPAHAAGTAGDRARPRATRERQPMGRPAMRRRPPAAARLPWAPGRVDTMRAVPGDRFRAWRGGEQNGTSMARFMISVLRLSRRNDQLL